MAGYQYRGKKGRTREETLEDAEERWQAHAHEQYRADPPPPPARKLVPCGTNSGYERHRTRHETPCPDCTKAHAKHVAEYRANPKPRATAKHGTPSGAVAHYRNRTPLCEPCKKARQEYRNQYKRNAAQEAYDQAMEAHPDNVWLGPQRLETLNHEVERATRNRRNHPQTHQEAA